MRLRKKINYNKEKEKNYFIYTVKIRRFIYIYNVIEFLPVKMLPK